MFPAAIEGAGIAKGVLPHIGQQLREGRLYAPFGPGAIANRGTFYVALAREAAAREAVKGFVDWLRSEARRDDESKPAPVRATSSRPRPRAARRGPAGR